MKRKYTIYIFSFLLVFAPIHRQLPSAIAQVRPDTTLGAESSQVQRQGAQTVIEGGATRGAALFHSFEQFSIAEDQQVFFANPLSIDTIFSRVTGKTPSNLNGMLGVLGNADLFLLNPNGVVFGSNAQLDLSGSFTASTANSLQVDEIDFSAVNPEQLPLLSINVLPGIQFGTNAPDRLIRNQAVLTLSPQQQLSFDSGTIEQLGQIIVPQGIVSLRAQSLILRGEIDTRAPSNQPGLLRLSSPDDVLIEATASLTNQAVSQALQNNEVLIESDRTLTVRGSISSDRPTALTLVAGDELSLLNDGTGEVSSLAANVTLQSGGDILITSPLQVFVEQGTPQLAIQADGDVSIQSETPPLGPNFSLIELQGDNGVLSIEAENLALSNIGNVLTIANSAGSRGPSIDISVNRDVVLSGSAIGTRADTGRITGDIRIQAGDSVQVLPNSSINSVPLGGAISSTGNIDIQAGDTIQLQSGLVVTQSTATAGDINFSAQKIILDGASGQSLIAADTQTVSRGDAGDITLNATESVELIGDQPGPFVLNSAQPLELAEVIALSFGETTVQASAFGLGASGKIEVNTDWLSIRDGALLINATGLFGSTSEAGDIVINANDVQLSGFALISTGTIGSQDAGVVEINSDRIRLDAGASIGASSLFGTGDAGTIKIRTDELVVAGGSNIAASSSDGGGGGLIEIEAQSITIAGTSADGSFSSSLLTDVSETSVGPGGPINITTETLAVLNGGQIRASTQGAEEAGDLTIKAQQVEVSGIGVSGTPSTIEAQSTGSGEAGDIQLNANRLSVQSQARVSTQSLQGSGGNILLSLDELLLLREQGGISATAGIIGTEGDGGNIDIEAGFVVGPAAENSDITANAFLGTGGNITVSTNGLLGIAFREQTTELSDITASSAAGLSGTVVIEQFIDDVEPDSIKLSETLASAENQLTAGCLLDEDASFVVTGRGGIPFDSSELLNQALIWNDSRATITEEDLRRADLDNTIMTTAPTTLTEAQGWRTNERGQVELVASGARPAPQNKRECL
ncbi:MAG: filamentous hemagglutinin N-terminal domain-containing protein [Phormidesmis sp.]